MIILQVYNGSDDIWGILIFGLLSTALIMLLGMSNRVNMGFKLGWVARPLPLKRKKILIKNFPYYNSLKLEGKKNFSGRVQIILDHKKMIPRGITQIEEETKVIIAACAVQLTFDEPSRLSQIKKILIYPNGHYPEVNQQWQSENQHYRRGLIMLSIAPFMAVDADPDSQIRLGLAAMSQALILTDSFSSEH